MKSKPAANGTMKTMTVEFFNASNIQQKKEKRMTIQKITIGTLATGIAHNTRTITDINTRKIIETISQALTLAYKEIEDLKAQLNQK